MSLRDLLHLPIIQAPMAGGPGTVRLAAAVAVPHVHHLTRPLRRAAADTGDADTLHLRAGEGFRAAEARPAGEVVERLARRAQRSA
jgi:NAD(P)H-dependent flavin oxidoreductase YrpB (nitropropane dioxygenase family)